MITCIIGTGRKRVLPGGASYTLRLLFWLPVTYLLMLLFMGMSFAQAVPDTAKVVSPGGYDALVAKLAQQETVRIMVKLNVEFQPLGDAASAESVQQMNRIASIQDQLLASLGDSTPRAVHKYSYIPYMFMEVDTATLQKLLASPLTVDVQEDIPVPPALNLSVPRIGATLVQADGYKGTGMVAAVLDTGVEKTHPFLVGSVVSEACYSTNYATDHATSVCPGGVTSSTAAGSAMPYAGNCPAGECDHGTHVAGIVAGRAGVSGSPGPGVAPEVGVIAIQVFTRFDNNVTYCGTSAPCALSYTSDQVKGLERVYALRSTYTISSANMSLGGGRYYSSCDTDSRKAIIDSLKAAGIATVISTGNDGYCGSMSAPGCISSAVSVGATTDSDTVASYSNTASFQELLAPGSSILSSIPGGSYASWNGTSMAAPHVTGAWALLKQAKQSATVDQILASLTSTGLSVTDSKCTSVTKKRINVNEAFLALGGPVTSVTLTPSLSSPRPVGTTITFTAAAAGGTGSPRYQFWLRNTAGVWSLVRAYSATPTWTWSTSGLPAGLYKIQVWAKNANCTKSYEAYRTVDYNLTIPPVSSVSLTASPASPRPVGTTITFTAAASGGSGSYQYQFWLRNTAGVWSLVRAYSSTPTWTWTTSGLPVGNYLVQVWAKNAGSTASYEAYRNAGYTLTVPPVSSVSLTASPTSPRPAGTSITFTAAASGGTGSYQYQFWLRNTAGVWSLVRAYSATPTWTWTTTGLPNGTYMVQVWARNAGSTASYEAYRTVSYTLAPPVSSVALRASPASPQPVGTTITFTAAASGGSGSYQYQFWVRNTASTWILARAYSSTPTMTLPTTGLPPGTYYVQVWARNAGSTASYEAYRTISYILL